MIGWVVYPARRGFLGVLILGYVRLVQIAHCFHPNIRDFNLKDKYPRQSSVESRRTASGF
jgi:hypothetical protein